jgi:hypothetical protein
MSVRTSEIDMNLMGVNMGEDFIHECKKGEDEIL